LYDNKKGEHNIFGITKAEDMSLAIAGMDFREIPNFIGIASQVSNHMQSSMPKIGNHVHCKIANGIDLSNSNL
jgi:hypothetical protein